jgi:hypothetical protein
MVFSVLLITVAYKLTTRLSQTTHGFSHCFVLQIRGTSTSDFIRIVFLCSTIQLLIRKTHNSYKEQIGLCGLFFLLIRSNEHIDLFAACFHGAHYSRVQPNPLPKKELMHIRSRQVMGPQQQTHNTISTAFFCRSLAAYKQTTQFSQRTHWCFRLVFFSDPQERAHGSVLIAFFVPLTSAMYDCIHNPKT